VLGRDRQILILRRVQDRSCVAEPSALSSVNWRVVILGFATANAARVAGQPLLAVSGRDPPNGVGLPPGVNDWRMGRIRPRSISRSGATRNLSKQGNDTDPEQGRGEKAHCFGGSGTS